MANRDQFTTEIYVNQEQANDALKKLSAEVDKTARAYEKLLNTKDADTAKLQKAKKEWESAKASLENVEKGVDEYRKALNNLSGKSMDSLLKMQRQINSELKKTKPDTEEWRRLSKEYGQVTERIKSLRKAQSELSSGMSGIKAAFSKAAEWTNKWGTAIMAIPLAWKKVMGALQGVINVTKQVINASQTMGDKWNNGMKAMKTTTDAFFMELSTGDWSAFNDGIATALKNARELAETMDLLGSYTISADYMRSEYLTSFQEHLNNARDTGLTKEERQAELESAQADMEQYNKTITDMADVTRESLIKEFKAVKGIDYTGDLEGFDAFFDELYKKVIVNGDNMVATAKAKLNELEAEYTAEGHWEYFASEKGMERLWVPVDKATAKMRALKEVTEEYGEDVVNLARASELSDEELKSLLERYKQAKSSEREVLTLERQLTRTRNQLHSTKPVDAYAEAIKKISKAENAQLMTLKQQYASGLIDKTRYEAEKAVIEEDFLKQKMATAEKYGKDTDQFMNQLLDRQIARMQKAKELLKEEMDEMEKYKAEDEARFGGARAGNTSDVADQEAYDSFQEKIWQKAADIRAAITEDSARTEYETEVKWAEKLAEQKKITAEEAEKYILQAKLKYAQQAAQQVNSIMEQASNFVTALKEMESAQLEAEYQAQLTAAGDNAEQREAIEADYEQKKLDLQKKYADVEMGINIAKAIGAGALAVMQAWAAAGGQPILFAIYAALIAATTAVEIATMVKQRNAIKNASVGGGGSSSAPKTGQRTVTGYAEGGYTEGHTTLTTVGEKGVEYVIPNWMVRKNPVMVANLERYRKAGSQGRNGSIERGFAEGGYTWGGGTMGALERPARPPKRDAGTNGDLETIVRVAVREEMPALMNALRVVLVRKDLSELDAQNAKFTEMTSR